MSQTAYIIWDTDPVHTDGMSHRLGGKAMGLHQLKTVGAVVPMWGTLSVDLFESVIRRQAVAAVLADKGEDSVKAARVRDVLERFEFPQDIDDLLGHVWGRVSQDGQYPVAVRSSASDEDGKNLSFAGQMDSVLNVRAVTELRCAVRRCYASLFSERAVRYRRDHGLDPWKARIAVVVQRMVPAEISGVVFTANPANGRRDETAVSSVWGLGEGLVSGALDADTFVLDEKGQVKTRELASKDQEVVASEDGGTMTRDVPADRRDASTLTDAQLQDLWEIAKRVERSRQMPMDIEFAVSKGVIHLLQARPITSLGAGAGQGGRNVWDNSNIVESYSGVTTPMTFSFIRRAYFAVYWQFCQVIGVDAATISRSRPVFENMLGLIQGRVYYNLLNWYRLISLMPGFSYNKRFMEQMMGLQVACDPAPGARSGGPFERYLLQLPRLVWVGVRMMFVHATLQNRVREFHRHFDAVYARYRAMDYERMGPVEVLKVYRELEEQVLWKWKAPILNDFEAMIFYGLLKSLTVKWGIDKEGTLHNDLLCGQGGIKSTKVVSELFVLAKILERMPELKAEFLASSPAETWTKVRSSEMFAAFRGELDKYLQEYGVRCVEEMKLESVPVKDDPVFCIAMLQNYLSHPIPDPKVGEERERVIRERAEKTLRERLNGQNIWGVIPKLGVYEWVLRNARQAVKNRENQRFARTEIYSLVRVLVRSVGRQWRERGFLDHADDIFYLTMEEMWSFIEGTAVTTDLRSLARLRRQEFDGYRASPPPPDHIETTGEVYADAAAFAPPPLSAGTGVLKGLGCGRGTVEGEVRVVLKPETSTRLNGEILVARQTDPGWVVLFPSISGLIVEKGSMLSHSAIVAREMGIPAVVGVKDASRLLKSGDRVRLDGAAGTVSIITRAEQ